MSTGLDHLDRVARVPFALGRPEDLPDTPAGLRAAAGPAAVAAATLRAADGGDLAGLLAATRTAAGLVAADPGRPVRDDPEESEENEANDLAFGIVRHAGDPAGLLVRAALAALDGVLDLAVGSGVGLSPRDWADIVRGVPALLDWLADPAGAPGPAPVPAAGPVREVHPEDALRRWVRGHHLFMVLCQGMSTGLRLMRTAEPGTAVAAARLATALMGSSRAALAYAGDVAQDAYAAEIRPTLMPPVAPPKMSGLHWRDHEELVRLMRTSGPAWRRLAHRPELLAGFRAELHAVYGAHRGVCAHFVGQDAPSLLANARSTRSATGVLDQFRQLRLDALPTGSEPTGSGPHPTTRR